MEILLLAFQIGVLLFSVIIHEISHGFMALKLGDETAKNEGRLTLNPVVHIDPIGSIAVPLISLMSGGFLFGWAKPVPYNPFALFKDFRYGPLKVALAGPASNLCLALVFGLMIRFAAPQLSDLTVLLMGFIVQLNLILFIFNLIPVPPLDGSKILTLILPQNYSLRLQSIGIGNIFLLIIVIFFASSIVSPIASLLFRLITGLPF